MWYCARIHIHTDTENIESTWRQLKRQPVGNHHDGRLLLMFHKYLYRLKYGDEQHLLCWTVSTEIDGMLFIVVTQSSLVLTIGDRQNYWYLLMQFTQKVHVSAKFFYGVTMPPKIFMGGVHCLAMPHNECTHALYGCFIALPPSCLLAQCDSTRLLRFRFAVRSHCLVIIFF